MIIQKVTKGIGIPWDAQIELDAIERQSYLTPDRMRFEKLRIIESKVKYILENGILCNWWLSLLPMSPPTDEIPLRLTYRNLYWHQNRYNVPDPLRGNKPFSVETPFISTSAGTYERDKIVKTNNPHHAKRTAFRFATDKGRRSGIVFYCYLFVIGKRSTPQQAFSEELHELNIYTQYSTWQLEGEITAKLIIPPGQIERAEIWLQEDIADSITYHRKLVPSKIVDNKRLYQKPEKYHNIRELR